MKNSFTPNASPRQKTAVRAAIRLVNRRVAPIQQHRHLDEAFDGGEFSGPAIDNEIERIETEVINHVADRFGIPRWQLGEMIMIWECVESDRYMDAVLG